MLQNLIKQAEVKAGTQQALSKRFNVVYSRFGDYKKGRRVPDDALIFKLAEYVGLDPMQVFFAVKAETDPENGELWDKWRAWRELNPRPLASESGKKRYFLVPFFAVSRLNPPLEPWLSNQGERIFGYLLCRHDLITL